MQNIFFSSFSLKDVCFLTHICHYSLDIMIIVQHRVHEGEVVAVATAVAVTTG